MAMDEKRIDKVVKDIENAQIFSRLERFPNSFYRLNEEEQKKVVEIYKEKLDKKGRPWRETT